MCYLELGYDHESAHALSGRLAPGSVTMSSFPFKNMSNLDVKSMDIASKA
jgi:hypothetical protein